MEFVARIKRTLDYLTSHDFSGMLCTCPPRTTFLNLQFQEHQRHTILPCSLQRRRAIQIELAYQLEDFSSHYEPTANSGHELTCPAMLVTLRVTVHTHIDNLFIWFRQLGHHIRLPDNVTFYEPHPFESLVVT